ncbi:MAG: PEP-CTERM sorting domain-containing protein [Alphaproteobacteria bacterium]|nr:PEP-CTERM sorting domain-containing protein [Alphaproteobacteria bacterium]
MKPSLFMASLVVLAGIAAGPASAAVINVTPTSLNGWSFSNLDNAPNTNASGGFEVGPSSPPLGIGSAQFLVNNAASSETLTQIFSSSVAVSSFANLSYATFVTTSTLGSGSAPTLQFDLFKGTTYGGRLVFDPGLLGTVVDNVWQNWDATGTSAAWTLSKSHTLFGDNCYLNTGNYCTFAQASALLDRNSFLAVDNLFKAGSGQPTFDGNVDAYTINATTYNFDPAAAAVPEPLTISLFAAGLVGAGAIRRRKSKKA